MAATETAPFNDAQLAATIPEKPLSSKSPDAEVRNPAHTLDLTPEVLPPVRPEADASRTAEVPGTPAKAWNQPEKGMGRDNPSQGTGQVQPRTTLPCPPYGSEASRETGSLKALTVPVTDKAEECSERQSSKNTLSFCFRSFGLVFVTTDEHSSVSTSYCLNRYRASSVPA